MHVQLKTLYLLINLLKKVFDPWNVNAMLFVVCLPKSVIFFKHKYDCFQLFIKKFGQQFGDSTYVIRNMYKSSFENEPYSDEINTKVYTYNCLWRWATSLIVLTKDDNYWELFVARRFGKYYKLQMSNNEHSGFCLRIINLIRPITLQ